VPHLARATIVWIVLVAAILLVSLFGLRQCQERRSQAAQSRLERSQAEAASNSAADAIGTVSNSAASERASEDLTRTNDKEIRNAQGADERVGAGVNAAGRAALCRREAYKNDPRCVKR
jgi:Tfp pilus assembly protein PilV